MTGNATEMEIRNTPLPADVVGTDTWTPIGHDEALDHLDAGLKRAGLEVDHSKPKRFTLTKKGARMFGQMTMKQRINDDVAMMIGVANSYDRSLSFKIGFGSHVFVCSNGCFFAQRTMGRKHTSEFRTDLGQRIDSVLKTMLVFSDAQKLFFDDLESINLTDVDAHHFAVLASRGKAPAITSGEIGKVVEEWHTPSFDEFKPRNAWSLHNAFTEVYKTGAGNGGVASRNGIEFADRSTALSDLMVSHFGLEGKYDLSQN